jgi:hypothetical protein
MRRDPYHSRGGAALLPQLPMAVEQPDCRVGIECDLPALPGLGLGIAAVDPEDRSVSVDMTPPQRRHLATAGSGDHFQPEQQTPFRVCPGGSLHKPLHENDLARELIPFSHVIRGTPGRIRTCDTRFRS